MVKIANPKPIGAVSNRGSRSTITSDRVFSLEGEADKFLNALLNGSMRLKGADVEPRY
jgi:hypothetical protein